VKISTIVLAIGIGAPNLLAAQTDSRLIERVDSATLVQVLSILQQASMVGLPTEPLIDKALEGSSRNASAEMIVRAVSRLVDGMITVRGVIGPEATAAELTSGALVLRAGANVSSLVTLMRARPGGDLTTPFGVLIDLVAIGVPAGDASRIVSRLTGQGHTDSQLLELQSQVVNDIRAGYPPVIAASVRSGVPTGAPPPVGAVVAEGVATPQP
jgi:hypothetical protein